MIKHIIDRIKTGVSYKDTWNLGHYINEITYEGLVKFREVNDGRPCNLTQEQWNGILDDMIEGYKLLLEDKVFPYKIQPDIKDYFYTTEEENKIKRAQRLFNKYQGNLWR